MATLQSLTRIRQLVARRLGLDIRSSADKEMFNDEANIALGALQADAPDAFDNSEEEVDVLQVVSFESMGIGVKLPSGVPAIINDRVLEIRTAADGNLDTFFPVVDGTWDGRYWLRVRASDGKSYDVQTREWWREEIAGSVPLAYQYFVSLVDPCPFAAGNVVTDVHAYQKHLWFPGDTREVKAFPYMTTDNTEVVVHEVSPSTAAQMQARNNLGSVTGNVEVIWQDCKFSLPPPIAAPIATEGEAGRWTGPFPRVSATVCYTLRWGRRTAMVEGERPRGVVEPLWESAPSPETTFSLVALSSTSIVLESFNVDATLGFDHSTLSSSTYRGRSGLRIAWWIKITALNENGGIYKNVPTNERFYLLAEVEPTDSVTVGGTPAYGAYEWIGDVIPDFEVPLVPTVGYAGYGYASLPDYDTSMRARVRRVPYELVHDYHYVNLKRNGLNAVLAHMAANILRSMGREGEAQAAEDRYDALAEQLSKTEGTPAGYITPGTIVGAWRPVLHKEIT